MITETGSGLIALIRCDYSLHHNWMSLVSWYSISKNLPDARVMVCCEKSKKNIDYPLFSWTNKFNVKLSYKINNFKDFNLEIPCDWMAINTWNEKNLFGEIKSNDPCTFCSYKNGCGNFVASEWIDKLVPPFIKVDSFAKGDLCVNELKVLELWRKVMPIYSAAW